MILNALQKNWAIVGGADYPHHFFQIPAPLQSIPWFGGGLLFYGAKANNGSIISCFEEEKKTLLLFFLKPPRTQL